MSATVIVLAASAALAADRLDLYDSKGNRTGYAVMERETGRVDYYDAQSQRTGWGRVDQSGRVERFDIKGRRQEPSALPRLPPYTSPDRGTEK